MTAYSEPVLLTSFYKLAGTGKTYAKVKPGDPVPQHPEIEGSARCRAAGAERDLPPLEVYR